MGLQSMQTSIKARSPNNISLSPKNRKSVDASTPSKQAKSPKADEDSPADFKTSMLQKQQTLRNIQFKRSPTRKDIMVEEIPQPRDDDDEYWAQMEAKHKEEEKKKKERRANQPLAQKNALKRRDTMQLNHLRH